jgi:hypothetical protein
MTWGTSSRRSGFIDVIRLNRLPGRVLLVSCVLAVVGGVSAIPANAQIGQLFGGSTTGSYCKIKKKEKIEVDTWLPLEEDQAFARRMTLRRLAAMAKSKGFSSIVLNKDSVCGILLINKHPRFRRCVFRAKMEKTLNAEASASNGDEWMSVDRIMSETDAEKGLYPVRTGLVNHGNKCVID